MSKIDAEFYEKILKIDRAMQECDESLRSLSDIDQLQALSHLFANRLHCENCAPDMIMRLIATIDLIRPELKICELAIRSVNESVH